VRPVRVIRPGEITSSVKIAAGVNTAWPWGTTDNFTSSADAFAMMGPMAFELYRFSGQHYFCEGIFNWRRIHE
jgi:hypothetical protein